MDNWESVKARLEKLEREALLNRQAAEKHYAYGERCLAIAKEAEDESQEAEERHKVECAELRQRVEELERENADLAKMWWESHAAATMRKRAEAAEADRDEWRDTARSEMAGRAALQAEVARLALIIQRLAPEVK